MLGWVILIAIVLTISYCIIISPMDDLLFSLRPTDSSVVVENRSEDQPAELYYIMHSIFI